jgi:hypothetical protein
MNERKEGTVPGDLRDNNFGRTENGPNALPSMAELKGFNLEELEQELEKAKNNGAGGEAIDQLQGLIAQAKSQAKGSKPESAK